MLKKKNEKASASTFNMDLKHLYPFEVVAKPYPARYVMPQFQEFIWKKGSTWESVLRPQFQSV